MEFRDFLQRDHPNQPNIALWTAARLALFAALDDATVAVYEREAEEYNTRCEEPPSKAEIYEYVTHCSNSFLY